MNKFKYRIYYEFLGPSTADPFATSPLTSDQIRNGIDKLCAILPDRYSTITEGSSLIITDTTNDSGESSKTALNQLVAMVNRTTEGLSLLAEELSVR